MSHSRSRFRALLLLTLFPFVASCAGEKEATVDPAVEPNPAVEEAMVQLQVTEAGSALAAALLEARQTDRLVFLHTGADW